MKNNRNYTIDVIRILATFLVIVNHTNSELFINKTPTITSFISMAYFYISKVAVGLFFVISGALLLQRSESYLTILKKRILPSLLILLISSLFYYLSPSLLTRDFSELSIVDFLIKIVQKPIILPLWYLYTYTTLMFALPFIRKMVSNMNSVDHTAFYLLCLVISALPTFISTVTGIQLTNYTYLGFFQMYLGYFVLGNYLFNIKDLTTFTHRKAIITLIIFISTIVFSVLFTMKDFLNSGSNQIRLDNSSSFMVAIGVYCFVYLAQYISTKVNFSAVTRKYLTIVSANTLGIYIIHHALVQYLRPYYLILSRKLHPLTAMVLYQFLIFIFGFAIISIIRGLYNLVTPRIFAKKGS